MTNSVFLLAFLHTLVGEKSILSASVRLKIKANAERAGRSHLEAFWLTDSASTVRVRLEQGSHHRKWSTAIMRTTVA